MVVQIEGDSVVARAGVVTSLENDNWTLISIESPVTTPVGSRASVSIDGTIDR